MEARDVQVGCPCCESLLDIDVRTGRVLRWRKKGEVDETGKPVVREGDWSAASDRVSKRLGAAGDKFDDSLRRERSRAEDLDDLFRRAKDKLRRGDE